MQTEIYDREPRSGIVILSAGLRVLVISTGRLAGVVIGCVSVVQSAARLQCLLLNRGETISVRTSGPSTVLWGQHLVRDLSAT